jgi:1,4-dihydroxy-2-naphthoate octaprenyltransferase
MLTISWREVKLFIRLSRPLFLLGGVLLYSLGVAIAAYIGPTIDVRTVFIGLVVVILIQMMTQYANEYFDSEIDNRNAQRTFLTGGSGAIGPDGLSRKVALYAAVICLALAATTCTAALINAVFNPLAWTVLLLAFLGAFFYNTPPLRLVSSGYGEFLASVVVAGLTPTFGFAVQNPQLSHLVPLTVIPLIAIMFSMLIAFSLPDYATDLKFEKKTLIVRLGWQWGMRLHDIAIVLGFFSLILGYSLGLPTRVALGSLIALPLGIAQIWQMNRIRNGFPARWNTFTIGALGLFVLTAYLELVGYLLS